MKPRPYVRCQAMERYMARLHVATRARLADREVRSVWSALTARLGRDGDGAVSESVYKSDTFPGDPTARELHTAEDWDTSSESVVLSDVSGLDRAGSAQPAPNIFAPGKYGPSQPKTTDLLAALRGRSYPESSSVAC